MSAKIEGRTIGERIRNARNRCGISMHVLLKLLDRPKTDQSWLSRIESGEREIRAKDLKAIATHVLVSVDDLIP